MGWISYDVAGETMSKSTEELLRELEDGGVFQERRPAAVATRPGRAAAPTARGLASSGLVLLIVAIVVIAAVGSLPFGSTVLYPFALFVTLIHESGHAIAAVATGGSVGSLRIRSDLSGVTTIGGGVDAIIAPAGYLGATLAGVGLLLTPLRYARWAMGALAAVPLAALLFFHPADAFTTLWCVGFALCLGAAAWKLPSRWLPFLQIFLGVEAGLNAFRDLMTLLLISGTDSHIYTDAQLMSRTLFFPATVWAVIWAIISMLLLLLALAGLVGREVSRHKG
jgi:hypothetical protein